MDEFADIAKSFKEGEEEYDSNEDREEYIKRMQAEGFLVVLPKPNEVFIDMDTDQQYNVFMLMIQVFMRDIGIVDYKVRPSKSGLPHRHALVTMPFDIQSDIERVAYQAAMGSDPLRESLTLVRIRRGDIHPTLFIEKEPW